MHRGSLQPLGCAHLSPCPCARQTVGGRWAAGLGRLCCLSPIPGLTLTPTLAPDLCFLALAPTPAQTLDLDHLEPTPVTRCALTLTPTHTLALTYSHPHLHPYRYPAPLTLALTLIRALIIARPRP